MYVTPVVLLRKTDVCSQHRKLDIIYVREHHHHHHHYLLILHHSFMTQLGVHMAPHVLYYTQWINSRLNLKYLWVTWWISKNLQHPQAALCGNICVESDIWYGKKQKGEGDRVYWRAGQTLWVLVEAAKGCLCPHILHKRLQKCQPARV